MIGKKIGKDNVYIHKTAIEALPDHLLARVFHAAIVVEEALEKDQFEGDGVNGHLNFIITHPNHIEFVHAEDFDTVHEPVLGARYRVDLDDVVTLIPRPAKPRILHQRYKTVLPDYKGFDIEADKEREKWYREHFTARDMAGAGFEHK